MPTDNNSTFVVPPPGEAANHFQNTAWLAGVFEFSGIVSVTPPSDEPCVRIVMKDREVIQTIAALWGVSAEQANVHLGDRGSCWQVTLRGGSALQFALEVYPWMGRRRKQQLDELISKNEAGGNVQAPQVSVSETGSSHNGENLLTGPFIGEQMFWMAGYLEPEAVFYEEGEDLFVEIPGQDEEAGFLFKELFSAEWKQTDAFTKSAPLDPSYTVVCQGVSAAALMKSMYPLMSRRRQRQVDKALASAGI